MAMVNSQVIMDMGTMETAIQVIMDMETTIQRIMISTMAAILTTICMDMDMDTHLTITHMAIDNKLVTIRGDIMFMDGAANLGCTRMMNIASQDRMNTSRHHLNIGIWL